MNYAKYIGKTMSVNKAMVKFADNKVMMVDLVRDKKHPDDIKRGKVICVTDNMDEFCECGQGLGRADTLTFNGVSSKKKIGIIRKR